MSEQRAEWIPLTEAAGRLGVHRNTMRRRVEQWSLTTRENPRNLRERLVNWTEIQRRLEDIDDLEAAK